MPTPAASNLTFSGNLSIGASNSQVRLLQEYLNVHGFTVSKTGPGSLGDETTYFGPATKGALIRFQKANGIIPAIGYFGPITRAYIASHPTQ
jgi:peptidoglycan hydrolase-like protein with peptidoglycan-binding domain